MIQEFVSDIDDYIKDARNLKKFVSGPIISIPLNERQEARLQGTIHTLQGLKDHYIDISSNAVTILPDGKGGLNISFPEGDTTEGVDIDEMQDTRRAVLNIYKSIDMMKASEGKEVPCATQIYLGIVDGSLDMTLMMRSNDVVGAFPADAYGFRRLQEYIAEQVGTPDELYCIPCAKKEWQTNQPYK